MQPVSEQEYLALQRNLHIIAFTIVEFVTLIAWRALVTIQDGFVNTQAELLSMIVGITVLIVGLTIEHIIAFKTLAVGKLPVLDLIIISITESGWWIIWLALAGHNQLGAFAFLFVAMFFQHSVERNVFNDKPFFSDLIKQEVIAFTAVEAATAGIWLKLIFEGDGLIGAGVLAIGLTAEHFLQANTPKVQA